MVLGMHGGGVGVELFLAQTLSPTPAAGEDVAIKLEPLKVHSAVCAVEDSGEDAKNFRRLLI